MLDWRYFTKQIHIKDLPLTEQKRRFLDEIAQTEQAITMFNSQWITKNPTGQAGQGGAGGTIAAATTTQIEMLTQEGFVLITQGGFSLILN
tara:strand:+ start:5965 stop:6237 length:273 start_codon:yes stop_codon:yes gene_type:complete